MTTGTKSSSLGNIRNCFAHYSSGDAKGLLRFLKVVVEVT